ncbi:hypothetical protein INT43_007062 [Umbelopsis isabellina]|uniref:Spindle pole body component n=1 Tax=Mortierella isabellina TaxID=91625 RepID=A0A8H7UGG2_MORIS|nr:hypothetical protein INT43_007062 [Umbelopsis isabellina]
MSKTNLLDQLVQEMTGIVDSQVVARRRKKIEQTLSTSRFPSTSNEYVQERYSGLIEKLNINNCPDKAERLQHCRDTLINEEEENGLKKKHLIYDILSMLINAANDPVKSDYDLSIAKEPAQEANVTWQSIVAEEPLTGSHWQQWESISTDDDSDTDDREDEKRRERSISNAEDTLSGRANKYFLSHIQYEKPDDIDAMTVLQSQQYWTEEGARTTLKGVKCVESTGMQAFADPCTLGDYIYFLTRRLLFRTSDQLTILTAPSLNELRLRSNDVRSITAAPHAYIKEVEAIQEVLFVLAGSAGQLFQRLSDDKSSESAVNNPTIKRKDEFMFKVHPQACLKHMSVLAFINILEPFCKYANSVNQLRVLKKVVIDAPSAHFGQTAQAFASSLDTPISMFEQKLSKLEEAYRDQEGKGSYISLLSLYDEIGDDLEMFSHIYDMYQEIDGLESALYEWIEESTERDDRISKWPLTITISLLNTLYHHVDVAQSSNSLWFSQLERLFFISFQPYARMIDSWISDGTLSEDIGSEFFLERNSQINVKSSRFWRHGYQLRNTEDGSPYPIFLHSFISKIFFSGKAMNFIFGMGIPKADNLGYTHRLSLDAYLCEGFDKRQLQRQEKKNRPKISPTERLLQSHFPTLSNTTLDPTPGPSTSHISPDTHMQDLSRHWYSSLLDNYIDPRYQHLAKILMDTLNEQAHLKHHLQSLACLFLMIEGDVMQRFADSIFIRMEDGKSWYDSRTLNALFHEACRDDSRIFHENVHIETKPMKTSVKHVTATAYSKTWSDQSFSQPLSVLETIIIHYQLPKSISNFIRRSTLQEYRKINTFILQIKRANRIMEQLLIYKGRFQTSNNNRKEMAKFYSLRLRLMWFVQTIHSYVLTTILHSETILFQRQLATLVNVDDIVLLHDDYVRKIVDRCLLNDKATTAAIRLSVIDILNKTVILSRLFKKFVQDPANRNFNQASMFMMLPPRIDSDEEASDSELADDGSQKDDNASNEDRYFVSFEQGLSLLSNEFGESLKFLTMTLNGVAKHGGLACFEILAQSLSV